MSTTTIRLPNDLKSMVAKLAKMQGKTPHAYILDALEAKTEMDSKAAEFEAEAMARLSRIKSGGKTLKMDSLKKLVRSQLRSANGKN